MAIIKRAKSTVVGLVDSLALLQSNIDAEALRATTAEGTVSGNVTALSTTVSNLDTATVKKTANLSDLADASVARTNLDVHSKTEVGGLITAAKLALGTNFAVADIAARDAMAAADLSVGDMIHVSDDGDTKWAKYTVSAIVGTTVTFVKISDQDSLENAISASSIKAAYESNTDVAAARAKVDFISATSAIDLDKVVQNDEFVTDLTGAVTAIQVASASAVKSYVDAKASAGGAKTVIENAVVAGSSITLANAPKDGLASVLNFGTVRYNDGVQSFDAPLMSTADPKVFTVGTDAAGDWDTFTVQVQYQFTSVA